MSKRSQHEHPIRDAVPERTSFSKSAWVRGMLLASLVTVFQLFSLESRAACSLPAANIGALDFQSGAFKYCDGTNWIGFTATASFPLLGPDGSAGAPSYSFSSSSNTGMYSGGAGTLVLATAGVDRIRINPNGYVGIGTTATRAVLEQAGMVGNTSAIFGSGTPGISLITQYPGIYFNAYFNSGAYTMAPGYAGQFSLDPNNGNFWIQTSGGSATAANQNIGLADRIIIHSNGNVGINTNSASEKLDVNGAVKIGNSSGTNAGTLRWDGTNFQGYTGGSWVNLVPNPPAAGSCDTTMTFAVPGTLSYTVPSSFGTITVKVWGGGGGGSYTGNGGLAGTGSSIASLGLYAGGGTTGNGTSGGTGGTASGGAINVNGTNGANGGTTGSTSAAGGNAPYGGPGGVAITGVLLMGNPGMAPGGGGGGSPGDGAGNPINGAGGGSGAYTEKTYTPATLTGNTTITDIIVGTGGSGGWGAGGRGGDGQVTILCSTTGTGTLARSLGTVTTATYTVGITDSHIIANFAGTVTLTLPSAALYPGREIMVRTLTANTVVSASSNVVPLAGGSAGTAILAATAGKWAMLVSDGTSWQIQMGN